MYDCTDEDIEAFLSAFEGEEETPDDDPRLESEVTQFEWLAEDVQPSLFLTEYGEVDSYKAIALLNDQSVIHEMTQLDVFVNPYNVFTVGGRYSANAFQGIIPDSGVAGISIVGELQVKALYIQILDAILY